MEAVRQRPAIIAVCKITVTKPTATYAAGTRSRNNLERRILSNVSTDYISQVEELLSEGRHVPAAVLRGAVLEDALRRLCVRQTPPVEAAKENGRPKKLDSLIQDLQKASAFNKLKAQQLCGWAQIRNSAAHGKFAEFSRDDVDLMVTGVRNFLRDHL